jgi:hypothetical protein
MCFPNTWSLSDGTLRLDTSGAPRASGIEVARGSHELWIGALKIWQRRLYVTGNDDVLCGPIAIP